VRAFRTGGEALNPLPHPALVKLTTTGSGPENCEWHLDAQLAHWLLQLSGWLIYNLHGLDDEGWGPVRAEYRESLLAKLSKMDKVAILPMGRALRGAI